MRKRSLNDKKKLCGHFGLVYHAEQWKLCSSSWSMRPWPMHNDAFIYLFFHFWFFFFFLFLWGGRAVGGTYAWPVVVWFWLTYVIHVQTLWSSQSIFMLLKKAVCMHGSIVSPIMLPPIATTGREIGLHVLQTEHNVWMFVRLYGRMPCTQGPLL